MPSDKKFYLTTPIYYVNARPHIGHAYSTIVADVIARRHRLLGDDTWFLTGTDEHGQKIERSAAAAGIPPQQFADQVSKTFSDLWVRMGITNDDFIRTTEARHKQGVQKLFADLQANDAIYTDTYTGQYCVSDEAYVEVGPGEPCPDCGNITETISESNYYFKLSAYGDRIAARIESNELLIQPDSRRNEILSFVRGGLKDLSISRTSFKWGIPVPGDDSHVIYVWLDALANYMTAVGYGSDKPEDIAKFERYWPANLHLVGKEIIRFHCVYWPAFLMALRPADSTLTEAEWNDKWVPKSIVANGWLLFEESKMSKSRGNVVRTETILDAFGSLKPELLKAEQDLFATDVLRYFLLREIPFGQDGSFSFDAFVQRYNSDLANGYGNLVNRTLTQIQNTFETIPQPPDSEALFFKSFETGLLDGTTRVTLGSDRLREEMVGAIFDSFKWFEDYSAASQILRLVGQVDGYLTMHAPWKLKGSPEEDLKRGEVLYTAAESIRIITALLYPILPHATAQVWSQLGFKNPIEAAAKNGELKDLKWGGLKPGTKLGPLAPIFPRAPKELIQAMIATEENNAQAAAAAKTQTSLIDEASPTAEENHPSHHPAAGPRTAISSDNAATHVAGSAALTTERPGTPSHTEAPASAPFANAAAASEIPDTPQIAIDDFVKIDLRVAKIIVAERIPKADKLLRLEVDLGYEKRQILSGIAEWYTPEDLIGRNIVVIANLAPRKMRGLESHGMLLAASHGENGKPVLATFGEEIALGSRLR
ncbi:methionyl-tRNA synthetase [Granulicella aggregans]|uniref:Methionine--tRNA ligase n=1 Tax=Granulicella aggregans TaxID=474949 RepID=A0A7W7ZDY5_9BACT|nr:methionine--tRNA ligase [Granulicella aggregans]MBB5057581.1 methionyl-tRNA synthetase [Granulicella aggregans]